VTNKEGEKKNCGRDVSLQLMTFRKASIKVPERKDLKEESKSGSHLAHKKRWVVCHNGKKGPSAEGVQLAFLGRTAVQAAHAYKKKIAQGKKKRKENSTRIKKEYLLSITAEKKET